MGQPLESIPQVAADANAGEVRRARFRAATGRLAERSSSTDLITWMLVPGSIALLLGLGAITLGWVGAARTTREIEQIPYLISGGLLGLALVILGGLLLISTFWVAVLRKLQQEADERAARSVAELQERVTALESPRRRRAG